MTKMTGDGTRAQKLLQSWENQQRLGTTATSLGIPRIGLLVIEVVLEWSDFADSYPVKTFNNSIQMPCR